MTEYKAQYRIQVTQFDQMGDWKDFGEIYSIDTDRADLFNIMKKVSVERSLHTVHPHVHVIEVRIVARESTPWDEGYKPKCPNCGSEAITDSLFERKTLHYGTQLVESIRCQRCMEKIFETVLKEE